MTPKELYVFEFKPPGCEWQKDDHYYFSRDEMLQAIQTYQLFHPDWSIRYHLFRRACTCTINL